MKRSKARNATSVAAIAEVSSIAAGTESKAKLQQVIGCTVRSRCSLDADCNSGIIAYTAGATVVLQNPMGNAQAHVIGTTKNNVTCLSLSSCGKYLVTGEGGHNPSLRVWELYNSDGQFAASQVANIKYHQEKIACVRFLSDGIRVVSVGNDYDGQIAVWDWRAERRIASARFVSRVVAMDETELGTFVTVGVRHVRFWYVPGTFDGERALMLQGRLAILWDRRNDTFVDVCCAPKNRTFAISLAKVLVEFNGTQLIATYDLEGETPFSLVLADNSLLIGFTKGKLRSFDMETAKLTTVNCKLHSLHYSITKGTSADASCSTLSPTDCRPPDVRALCYDKKARILTAKCSDQSLHSWQKLVDGNAISELSSQHFHFAPIFAVEVYGRAYSFLPAGTFITAAADATIRIWNYSQPTERFQQAPTSFPTQVNVYWKESKVIHIDDSGGISVDSSNKATPTLGARSIRISPDGRHLACGRTDGNVHIYDLTLPNLPLLAMQEVHEAEVMCLEYSNPLTSARYLMASGGRDRFIHVYDPLNGYLQLASIDDLTSTVHSIAFASFADELILLSYASDKTIVVRKMIDSQPSLVCFERLNQITAQFGFISMAMGADGIVVACLDKQLKTFSLQGKLVKQIKVSTSRDGQLTKLKLHPEAALAAVVCTDRRVYIVNLSTGDCEACLSGMSGIIADVAFSSDCRHLIVVSSNGCIFLWRLADFLMKKVDKKQKRMKLAHEHIGGILNELNERSQAPECSLASGIGVAGEETGQSSRADQVEDLGSELESVGSEKLADEIDIDCVSQKQDSLSFSATHILRRCQRCNDVELNHTRTELIQTTDSNLPLHFESSFIQRPVENEMAERLSDCLNQWNTVVDLVLQFRELLQTSQNLSVSDRERMLDMLKSGVFDGRRRMDIFDHH